ncbi:MULTISPECIES: DUF6402 family protein [unclassified Pseudomonas]|uniref:DUF6402 family protein n=1 Tax=unclassified Pseudomonas TaxID=196821 RepID=UPI000CD04555|nr:MULTISPECIES: DUF6402 family protein [unclassified Pseudomonas]POA34902.1 hypothetical protein C1887_02130 [Pseudomonas sp. GW456-R21]POA70859.1 hypothetical protein C1884_01680 [Pseudomonas sp. GW460-R15]
MATTTVSSTMTPASNKVGRSVAVCLFKVTDIPDAMRKMNWPVAADLMQHWFDGKPWPNTDDGGMAELVKSHDEFAPEEYINETIVTMSWAMTFDRTKAAVDSLRNRWNNPAAQEHLRRKVLLPAYKDKEPGVYPFKFSKASEVERVGCANSETIVFNQSGDDDVNELRAALANFNVHVFADGNISVTQESITLIPERIGFYVEDSYDFNDGWFEPSQALGYWNFDGLETSFKKGFSQNSDVRMKQNSIAFQARGGLSPEQAQEMNALEHKHYMFVQNGDFRDYRKSSGKGGDFRVYSDILYENVSAAPIEFPKNDAN